MTPFYPLKPFRASRYPRERLHNLVRESFVLRASRREAEEHFRHDNAPLGYAIVKNSKEVNPTRPDSYGGIFLLDKLKRLSVDEGWELSVDDQEMDGTPFKLINVFLPGSADSVFQQFWIDLKRNGHIVKHVTYDDKHAVTSRQEITLASFVVGNKKVWMPVAGQTNGYVDLVDHKPVTTREATVVNAIHVVAGTMVFNKKPGPEVFNIKYKLGTPISDNLRQMNYEFGQQKIGAKPTVAVAEKMLGEQVAKANEQKGQLISAAPDQGWEWWFWSTCGLALLVLTSVVALIASRRRLRR